MCFKHNTLEPTGDCLECIKEQHYDGYLNKYQEMYGNVNFADAQNTADKFIDGTLKAIKPITVYSSPGGTAIKTYKKGDIIGNIYSYVVKDGVVWWQLANNNFVKHESGAFDADYLNKSLIDMKAAKQKTIDERAKVRMDANQNPLYRGTKAVEETISHIPDLIPDLGTIKWVIIAVVIVVMVALFLRIKG